MAAMTAGGRPEDQPNSGQLPEQNPGPVILITNPYARHASYEPSAREVLQSAGIEVGQQLSVLDLDPQDPQGWTWRQSGFTAAVAAGGDGTIGSVATQLAGSDMPLGILPLGTSNDVARSLGLPLDLAQAARVIASGTVTSVDAGKARTLRNAEQEPRWVYFVHAATLGLNAEFARLATDVAHREQWGNLSYATAAFEALLRMPSIPLTIQFSGVRNSDVGGSGSGTVGSTSPTLRIDATQVSIVNTPIFGGRMNLQLPQSQPRDQLLDFVIIESLGPLRMLEMVEHLVAMLEQNLPFGRTTSDEDFARRERAEEVLATSRILPGVWQIQAEAAQILTDAPTDVTLDGELGLQTPVEIRVAQDPLRVLLLK